MASVGRDTAGTRSMVLQLDALLCSLFLSSTIVRARPSTLVSHDLSFGRSSLNLIGAIKHYYSAKELRCCCVLINSHEFHFSFLLPPEIPSSLRGSRYLGFFCPPCPYSGRSLGMLRQSLFAGKLHYLFLYHQYLMYYLYIIGELQMVFGWLAGWLDRWMDEKVQERSQKEKVSSYILSNLQFLFSVGGLLQYQLVCHS